MTLYHVWLSLGVFGGMVEYPLYFVLYLLWANPLSIMKIFLLRKFIGYILRTMSPSTRPRTQVINFVDLPELPRFIKHPDTTYLPATIKEQNTTTQFIQLLHPHGMFTAIAAMYGASRIYPPKTVLLIDPVVYALTPIGIELIEYACGNLTVSYSKHVNICALLRSGHNLLVFAGVYNNEILDFTDETESIHIDTYQYWMRMSRQFSTKLVSTIFYDGSTRYFRLCSIALNARLWLARYGIPLIIPIGIRFPVDQSPMYTRHISWHTTVRTNEYIMARISRIVKLDRPLQYARHVVKCDRPAR